MPQLSNPNIYTIDWQRLVRWLLPVRLRQSRMVAWLAALTSPIKHLHDALLKYREDRLYFLHHTSQVVYMEAVLNDVFDDTARGIYIIDGAVYDPLWVYVTPELKPLYVRMASENTPQWLYTELETVVGQADFIVRVPSAVVFDVPRMKALIDLYRLPGKSYYKIETF